MHVCIDSTNPKALQVALDIYQGKPLVNLVTGEEHSLKEVLSLVQQYRTAVIGLVQGDEGIPKDVERRIAIAHRIVNRAEAVGIHREDIVIDRLVFAVGAEPSSGPAVIEAIRRVRDELGVNITLGVSNIS